MWKYSFLGGKKCPIAGAKGTIIDMIINIWLFNLLSFSSVVIVDTLQGQQQTRLTVWARHITAFEHIAP